MPGFFPIAGGPIAGGPIASGPTVSGRGFPFFLYRTGSPPGGAAGGVRSPLAFWMGGAGNVPTPSGAGPRSFLAFWMGGAGAGATGANAGFRSFLAFWMGGASNFGVAPPVIVTPPPTPSPEGGGVSQVTGPAFPVRRYNPRWYADSFAQYRRQAAQEQRLEDEQEYRRLEGIARELQRETSALDRSLARADLAERSLDAQLQATRIELELQRQQAVADMLAQALAAARLYEENNAAAFMLLLD